MTLCNVKMSTKDIDFVVQSGNLRRLADACSEVGNIRADLFERGFEFNNPLPDSCMTRAKKIMKLNHITLFAMDKIDVIMTKIARASESDIEDISSCMDAGVTADDIYKHTAEYGIDTPELRNNLRYVMHDIFDIDPDSKRKCLDLAKI